MRYLNRLAVSGASILLLGATATGSNSPVRIDTGLISGITESGATAYLGIPFAAPPVGDLRWRPPQPAAHWKGVRAADHFGASCMQDEAGSRLPWTKEFMTQGPISEDCLFLNVWTAAKPPREKQAVMVFIYGGGFSEGSTVCTVYNGAALATKGVVVVSMNYRIGALGFLVYPELTKESEHHSSGNYGLLDQIAALHWVQRNIAAFGGDPSRVTIFGQSAGAISVEDLMRSPLAKGLFARAIAESGPGLFPENLMGGADTLEKREQQGVKYAEAKGAHSLADLRAMPAGDFFKHTPGAPGVGGPVTDGWVLPAVRPPREVPLIVGMVTGDTAFSSMFGPQAPATVDGYKSVAQKVYGDRAAAFLQLYAVEKDSDVPAAKAASQVDRTRVALDMWCVTQAKRSGTVYTYYFDHPIPWPAHPEFGAFHSAELPYIFETLKVMDRPWTPEDFKLSQVMSSYWSNFAKTGDPNGPGLPPWPAYHAGSHTTMELGDHVGPIPEAGPAKVKFFVDYFKK
ncbi:MAG TPA: carboxylesterase family protein [Terriglobia bacterium]|nr:carboxylesterase family protein [Terriglobia bacterium]